MNEANFTRGPWRAEIPDGSNGYWYIDNRHLKGGSIATCYTDNAKNNAYLIASAPKMYEKLEELAEFFGQQDSKFCVEKAEEIESLLAEARGEPNA